MFYGTNLDIQHMNVYTNKLMNWNPITWNHAACWHFDRRPNCKCL